MEDKAKVFEKYDIDTDDFIVSNNNTPIGYAATECSYWEFSHPDSTLDKMHKLNFSSACLDMFACKDTLSNNDESHCKCIVVSLVPNKVSNKTQLQIKVDRIKMYTPLISVQYL